MKQTIFTKTWKRVGGLSTPSKMNCYGYSISPKHCQTGAKLAKLPNTVCSKCYAKRGHYVYPVVQKCLARRFRAIKTASWVTDMAYLIKVLDCKYFRWFDSGSITSITDLAKICELASLTPETKHWLPTNEYSIIADYLRSGRTFPHNLTVRLSSYFMDSDGPITIAQKLGVQISEVRTTGYTCPAPKQGNKCLDCRLCWDKNTFKVAYKRH